MAGAIGIDEVVTCRCSEGDRERSEGEVKTWTKADGHLGRNEEHGA